LIDLAAARVPAWQLRRAADLAERRGLLDARGRRLLEIETRSPLEDAFLHLCHDLPRPRVNESVEGFEVDFHWPEQHIIVETDGHEHHGSRAAFERDRERDQTLIAAGWTVLRFTHRQISDAPERVRHVLVSVRSRSPATP
jgi:very-short-patch-repair endonuclease